uniref:Putative ovule protein n=1 Tax=Solanum chacoense TaxID=4108 RepID=A0A0V0ITQ3_SOLCH
MSSSFQASILVASPSHPNSVAWSEENLVAVASGHIVTILNPAKRFGSRGLITIPPGKPFSVGFIERKDLLSDCMLHIALSRDSSPQEKQYRENRPCVRSISWSPIGFASNSGCLLAVCTTEGHVRLYRMPFLEFSTEWVEVMDISNMLYSYLKTTNFQAANFRVSEGADPSQACFDEGDDDDLPISIMRKELKRRRLNALPVMEVKACSQKQKNTFTAPRLGSRFSKKVFRDGCQSLITAEEYASRNAMLSSLIVAWSPCLPQTSGCGISSANGLTSSCSVLAVGGKSGVLSLWRIHKPESYSIMNSPDSNKTVLVGLLDAHDTWITTISWSLFISDASDPLLLLATGCSNGSVKIWQACCRRLVESSEPSGSPFSLLKEVNAANFAMATMVSLTVSVQSPNKMLLAIGKGSGSIEVWTCDILLRRFEKAGTYDAHNHAVTGLSWAFDGRCLYSCSQDDSTRCWILYENSLCEVPIPSNTPGVEGSADVPDAFCSCLGLAISPGNLVLAVVRAFSTALLNPMYEARALKAAVEFLWIGGQQLEISSTVCPDFDVKIFPDFPEKELISWENNILWSLNQHEPLDKPLVVWDVVAALLAFKQSIPKYVEHIVLKWLKSSVGVSANLSEAIKCLSEISSRKLQLLNIISKLVVLKKVETDKLDGKSQLLEVIGGAEDERLDWTQLHSNSEMELRDRLVGYSFTVFLDVASASHGKGTKPGYWVPIGTAQMEQWVAIHRKDIKNHLKLLADEVRTVKKSQRPSFCEYVEKEECSFCSASVPFDSPDSAICRGVKCDTGNDPTHKLSRCAVSMRICPIAPVWHCMCCQRWASILAPSPIFRMPGYPSDFKSNTDDEHPKPWCPFCGIPLKKLLPEFLLSPSFV